MPTNIKLARLVGKIFTLKDRPFDIGPYPYLNAIYNTKCYEVGLFTARQIAKSTTLASMMVALAALSPAGTDQILVTPLEDQAQTFSKSRLADFLASPFIKHNFFTGERVVDQVLHKVMSNGNQIMLGYAQRTADRLRGRSASRIGFDEVQDICPEVIPIIREMAFRAAGNTAYWYCGTPKSYANHMEMMRRRSTENEWAVKCEICKHWNLRWDENNISNPGVCCAKCKKLINTNIGEWVSNRKLDKEISIDSKITMESYRIPQLIVKPVMDNHIKWRELLAKYRDYSTAQLYNEVFGLPFDSGTQPVTMDQLKKCCDSNRKNELPDPNETGWVNAVLGVDWAFRGENSFTFVVIGGWDPMPGAFKVYYWKLFKGAESDSLFQIQWIIDTVKRYKIKLVGADWGAGHVQNLQLINALGEESVMQLYHTSMGASGGGRNAARVKYEPRSRKYHLARTAVLTDTFEDLKGSRVRLPRYEDNEVLLQHIMAEGMEYNESTNRAHYTNSQPDDGLHALCYAQLAGEFLCRGDFRGHMNSTPVTQSEIADWHEDYNSVPAGMYE